MNKIQVVIKKCTNTYNTNNFRLLYDQLVMIIKENKHEEYKEEIKDVIHLIVDFVLYGEKNDSELFE